MANGDNRELVEISAIGEIKRAFRLIRTFPDLPLIDGFSFDEPTKLPTLKDYFSQHTGVILDEMGGIETLSKLSASELYALYPYFFKIATFCVDAIINQSLMTKEQKEDYDKARAGIREKERLKEERQKEKDRIAAERWNNRWKDPDSAKAV